MDTRTARSAIKHSLTVLVLAGLMLLSHAVQAVAPNEFAGAWYRFQTEVNASPSYYYYWFGPDGRYLEGIPTAGRYASFDCATPRTKDEWQSCGTYPERGESTVYSGGQSAVLGVTSSADVTARIVRAEYAVNGQRALIAQVSPLEAWQWSAQTGVQPMASSDAADLRSAFSTGWFGFPQRLETRQARGCPVAGTQALRVTNKGLAVTYSFDAAGRIASQTAQSPDGEVIVRMSDYRQVQGVWIALTSESFLNGQRTCMDRTLEVGRALRAKSKKALTTKSVDARASKPLEHEAAQTLERC